jgi:DNA-binding response OmpR family regulator
VLLVDDHRDTADALALLLEDEGFTVTVAHSVSAALAAATAEHEVLISDIALPDGNGRGLLSALRDRGLELPAIAMTGFGTADDSARSLAAGFRRHLVKPLELPSLLAAIGELRQPERPQGARSG